MQTRNEADFAKKAKEVKAAITDSVQDYAELSDIRQDLESLKSNVVALTKHLQKDGSERVAEAKDAMQKGLHTLREKGEDGFEILSDQIKENPRRAVLVAFLAGIVTNMFLRRD